MALPVISVVNMKGGVGKTTLTVALAETIAVQRNKRVLVIDVDAQASATFAFLGEEKFRTMRREGRHAGRLMAELGPPMPGGPPPSPMSELIWQNASSLNPAPALDLVGAVPALQKLERQVICDLAGAGYTRQAIEIMAAEHLVSTLAGAAGLYDVVLIDCPPGISAFTEAAVRVSKLVIAPFVPEFLSALGLETFLFQCAAPLARERAWTGRMIGVANRVTGSRDEQRFFSQIADVAEENEIDISISKVRVPQDAAIARAVEPAAGANYAQKYGSSVGIFIDLADEALAALNAKASVPA